MFEIQWAELMAQRAENAGKGKDQSSKEQPKPRQREPRTEEHKRQYPTTEEIMRGGGNRDTATPGDGVLTSDDIDRDAATG